jgi:hypothetical protein
MSYNSAEVQLVCAVTHELGRSALEEAYANYGSEAIQWEDDVPYLHVRPGRWVAAAQDVGVLLFDTRGGVRRVVLVRGQAIVKASAEPLTHPTNN